MKTIKRLVPALAVCLAIGVTGPTFGAGATPSDPIPFDLAAGSISVAIAEDAGTWLRVDFVPASTVSHVALETEGDDDTVMAVYANLSEALVDNPIVEDDDGGSGLNASLRAALGFPSPYLVRLTTYSGAAGATLLRGELTFVDSERCDWPAGCPLAVAAQGEATASGMLTLLRQVRSEILSQSPRGRDLIDVYWRLGTDLLPDLLADGALRRRTFREVAALLPLAQEAVEISHGTGGGASFSGADHDRLRALLELLTPRLSSDLAAELWSRWHDLELAGQVGRPLAEALAKTGLLPARSRPHTVIAKLSFEPAPDVKSGRGRTGEARLDALLATAGARKVRRVHAESPGHRSAGLTRTIVFEIDSLAAASDLAARLGTDPSIVWAQPSAELRAYGPPGSDPFRGDLWGLDAIRAPEVWSSTTGQCSTRVAVVDTGLRADIADLEGRILHDLGYDFVNDDPDPHDGHGHGTHVTSTVAAALNNSTSIAGVAPGVCVFGVKVLDDEGSGTSEDVAAGIVHAVDAGARVINLSLGCDCETQQVIEEALEYAAAHDVVVAAASGNDSLDRLGYPAASDWAMAVGAVDQNLELAEFSNYGPGLALVAPGVDVVSVFIDGESCTGSGTSMATPHVSGVAALVRSKNPNLGREEVQALLENQAMDLGEPGYDTWFGAGLVDALAAVSAAGSSARSCTDDLENGVVCLYDDRFELTMTWTDLQLVTRPVVFDKYTHQSALGFLNNPNDIALVVKVTRGCIHNNNWWIWTGGASGGGAAWNLRVVDTETDRAQTYSKRLGPFTNTERDSTSFPCQ